MEISAVFQTPEQTVQHINKHAITQFFGINTPKFCVSILILLKNHKNRDSDSFVLLHFWIAFKENK